MTSWKVLVMIHLDITHVCLALVLFTTRELMIRVNDVTCTLQTCVYSWVSSEHYKRDEEYHEAVTWAIQDLIEIAFSFLIFSSPYPLIWNSLIVVLLEVCVVWVLPAYHQNSVLLFSTSSALFQCSLPVFLWKAAFDSKAGEAWTCLNVSLAHGAANVA